MWVQADSIREVAAVVTAVRPRQRQDCAPPNDSYLVRQMEAILWVLVGVMLAMLVSRLRTSTRFHDVMRGQVCRRRT
jgi:hypothetical protein